RNRARPSRHPGDVRVDNAPARRKADFSPELHQSDPFGVDHRQGPDHRLARPGRIARDNELDLRKTDKRRLGPNTVRLYSPGRSKREGLHRLALRLHVKHSRGEERTLSLSHDAEAIHARLKPALR